jgi:hypothetical protein
VLLDERARVPPFSFRESEHSFKIIMKKVVHTKKAMIILKERDHYPAVCITHIASSAAQRFQQDSKF